MVKWQRNINITNCPHAWGTPSMRARTRRILHTFPDITKEKEEEDVSGGRSSLFDGESDLNTNSFSK